MKSSYFGVRPERERRCVAICPRAATTPKDYRGLAPDGSEWPMLDVWVRQGPIVRHFWGGEMSGETADPGQDPRGAPDPAPLWTLLDLTPGGRGTDWRPSLEYSQER